MNFKNTLDFIHGPGQAAIDAQRLDRPEFVHCPNTQRLRSPVKVCRSLKGCKS